MGRVGFAILIVICGVPLFSAPPTAPGKQADAVLDELHAAAAAADGKRYFACFHPDAVFLGTDPAERWTLEAFRAYAAPHFDAGRGWTYRVEQRNLSRDDTAGVIWFDERLGNDKYGTCRGTGVLLRRNGELRISQYSLSIPIPNDLALDVVDLIRKARTPKPVERSN